MNGLNVDSQGELTITPSPTSSRSDFDFYAGKWVIQNRKLESRLTNCNTWIEFKADQEMQIILNGFGNTDNFITDVEGKPFEGRTLRLFDPTTRLWSMYWVDSNALTLQSPTVGSFYGDVGLFYAKDTFEAQEILVVFKWDKTNPRAPIWSQAFSNDQGKSWEWNWYMHSLPAIP